MRRPGSVHASGARYCRVSSMNTLAKLAEAALREEPQLGTIGQRAPRQRHVLVVGLIRRGATRQEPIARVVLFGRRAGVVVLDFVIVPRDQPWTAGVRGLQLALAAIQRVTYAIVIERNGFRRVVMADALLAPARFVDVIADVQNQIQFVLEHVSITEEVAMLVLLTRSDGDAHPRVRSVARAARCACARSGFVGRRQ